MDSPRNRPPIATFILTAMFGLAHTAADAQAINRCRINGRLVIQSSPCPLDAPKSAAESAAATSPVPSAAAASSAAPKKKTLADLLRERDGTQHPRPVAHDSESDGANILRARMGAV